MRSVDRAVVHVLVDNTVSPLERTDPSVASEMRVLMEAGMAAVTGEGMCSGHHGLSLVVTAEVDGVRRTLLFDAGPDPYAVERNGTRMGIPFGEIEAMVLSHGHFDHAEGLPAAVRLIRASNGGRPVPLHVHPGAFVRRGMRLPDGRLRALQEIPAVSALTDMGVRVVPSSKADVAARRKVLSTPPCGLSIHDPPLLRFQTSCA